MRISLLMKREPFPEILEKTLSEFFSNRHKRNISVYWINKDKIKNSKDSQKWICNYYLNSIFIPEVNSKVLSPVVNEFSRSTKFWMTPLNKLYTMLGVCKWTASFLANAFIEINPYLPDAKNLLIIGGNHHIRVLDLKEACCYIVNKKGFDRSLIGEELKIRKEYNFLPVPKIKRISADLDWYSENLIFGTPINRLLDKKASVKIVEKIIPSLFRLYEATYCHEDLGDYIARLLNNIKFQVNEINILRKQEKEKIIRISLALSQNVFLEKDYEKMSFATAQAHGDFQSANILLGDDGKLWLIDWEYTGKKQIAYDGLVYCLQSRKCGQLANRIKLAMEGNEHGKMKLMFNWPYLKWGNAKNRRIFLCVFLLEEVLLKIIENDNSHFKTIGLGFNSFIAEVEKSVRLLQI